MSWRISTCVERSDPDGYAHQIVSGFVIDDSGPSLGTHIALRVEGLTAAAEADLADRLPSDGRLVRNADGAAMCLVRRAAEALAVALQLGRGPTGAGLRVAVHVGEVSFDRAGVISGPAVEALASLAVIGGRGRVVCSEALYVLADGVDDAASFEVFGRYPLSPGARAQSVMTIRDAGTDPGRAITGTGAHVGSARRPAGMGFAGTSFVGRHEDLRDLGALFADPFKRLVTIVGPGGCGKTRLAAELLPSLAPCCPDGQYWVDLAGCHDAIDSGQALLDAVGCREEPGRLPADTVAALIGDGHVLIVFDNCEHLVDVVVAVVESISGRCARVRLLATSREPLGMGSEWPWRVAGLQCPPLGRRGPTSLDELRSFGAVQLFVDRARQVRPTFALTEENSGDVAEVCAQLDGVPLAIELAAARARGMSPGSIAKALGDRFRLLRGGTRHATSRHATMLASLEWSYGLLDPLAQTLFRRLAVFPADFDLGAAEAVGADGVGVVQIDVLEALYRLVDRSMLLSISDPHDLDECRFRMLETMRQFALEHCGEASELSEARDRHLRYYVRWIERLDGRCPSDETQNAIEREYLNVRGALEWSTGQPELALRLLEHLALSWANLGHHADARRWGRPILDAGPGAHPERWASAVGWMSDTLMFAGDEGVIELLPRAMEIAEGVGDHATLSYCHSVLCIFGRDEPMEHAAEALRHARAAGDRFRLAVSAILLSLSRTCAGYLDEVAELRAEGMESWRGIGNRSFRAQCALIGAMEPTIRGDIDRAVAGTLADAADVDGPIEPCSMSMCASGLAYVGMLAERDDMVVRAGELFALPAVQTAVAFVASEFAKYQIVVALRAGGADVEVGTVRELVASPWENWYEELGHAALLGCERFEQLEGLLAEKSPGGPYPACRWELTRAHLAMHRREFRAAEDHAHAAFEAAQAGGYGLALIDALETLAALADTRVTYSRLLGFAARRRQLGGYRFRFPHLARALGHRLDDLDPVAYAAALELDVDQAVAWVGRTRGKRKRPSAGWESLTPTERRVVQLVAAGRTNPQIGEQLLMSRSTVKTHMTHIFTRLDVKTRSQLAARAAVVDGSDV